MGPGRGRKNFRGRRGNENMNSARAAEGKERDTMNDRKAGAEVGR